MKSLSLYTENGSFLNKMDPMVKVIYVIAAIFVPAVLGNNWVYGAKTGTSNFTAETKAAHGLASDAINDLWCTALTDQYTVSVWYGYDKIDSTYYTRFLNSNHIILLRTIASQVWERGAQIAQPESVVRVEIEKNGIKEKPEILVRKVYLIINNDFKKALNNFEKNNKKVDILI